MSLRIAVTGGSSGIGLAIARQFAAKGHTVYSLSRRPSADGVRHIPCDVADESSVRQAFAALEQAEGALDILVNNAGFGISGAAEFTDLDKAKALFDVGYFGLLACVKHALPLLRKSASPLPDSHPKLRYPQPSADKICTPPAAKPSADCSAAVTGSSSTRSAPASTAARARTRLSKTAGSPRWT